MATNSASKAWMVAASIGAVEALKDQGFCRWNYALRSAHHHLRSLSQLARPENSIYSRLISINKLKQQDKPTQSEDSLKKVMFLTCWAPN